MTRHSSRITNGFTNVELLVVLVIVALLISIVAYAIIVVQRNQRNTERRTILKDTVLEMGVVQSVKLKYPSSISVNNTGNNCEIIFNVNGANLPDPFVIEDYTCDTNVATNCATFSGEEMANDGISLCYDVHLNQIGMKLENSNTPNIIKF